MMRHISTMILGLAVLSSAAAAQSTMQPPRQLPTTKITADTSNYLAVQNDRASTVTVYARVGAFDRRLGTVAAGQMSTIPIPTWAVSGETSLKVFARADGEDFDLVTQTFPLRGAKRLGLLIPPRGGLASSDSLLVKMNADKLAATTITLNNGRNKPVTVFAEQGIYSVRLGEVRAGEQATLRVPKSLIARDNTIRVFVRPAGGTDQVTQLLQLKQGEHVGIRM
jgi:hypothetical protein